MAKKDPAAEAAYVDKLRASMAEARIRRGLAFALHCNGLTLTEIGKVFGLSRTRVSQLIGRAECEVESAWRRHEGELWRRVERRQEQQKWARMMAL